MRPEYLYTQDHAEAMREIHRKDAAFGSVGHLWAPRVAAIVQGFNAQSILDYGCGKGTFIPALLKLLPGQRLTVQEYDPAFKPANPAVADMVCCFDVLEHVEPAKLGAVLGHIHLLMRENGIISVSLRDGKSTRFHPIRQPREWWMQTLQQRFSMCSEIPPANPANKDSELAVWVEP